MRERNKKHLRLSDTQFACLIIAPSLIVLGFIIIFPLIKSILTSFQEYELSRPASLTKWVGLEHYRLLLREGSFLEGLKTTFIYSISAVLGQFVVGFILALILNRKLPRRNFFRGLFLIPWVIPTVVCALLWTWILNVQYGIWNFLLRGVGIIDSFQAWLSNPSLAMYSVVGVTIWKWFPFDMVMLLASFQTVPPELLDAASVDGAGTLRKFWHVTLPHTRNIMVLILLLTTIWSFQEFTMIWGTTKGGPMNITSTLNILIYRTAFQYFKMGQAAALGVLYLLIMLVVSIFVLKFGFAKEIR